MHNTIANYFRTHRKRSGLKQTEIAYLLGLKSGQIVSRHERLDRKPNIDTMFGYQIIFNVLPHELYPGLYEKVENVTIQRIHALADRLGDDAGEGIVLRKHDVLKQAIERIGLRRNL